MTHALLQYKVRQIVLMSLQAILIVVSRQTTQKDFLRDLLHNGPISLVHL